MSAVSDIFAPLSKQQAKQLDQRVRVVSDRITRDLATLLGLLDDAGRGSIHIALGCSWRSWSKDAVRLDCKALAKSIAAVKPAQP